MQPDDDFDDVLPRHSRVLKAVRRQRGWSQTRLAQELCVSVRTIKRWEKGADPKRDPHPVWVRVFEDLLL